jgi:hypothetical protein
MRYCLRFDTLEEVMADLSEETLTTVFDLQRRLLKILNEATKCAFMIFQQYGEIEATMPDLGILENVKERSTSSCTRLHRLLLQISDSQPTADSATLELLSRSIEQIQASTDAGEATVQEVKRDWNLL